MAKRHLLIAGAAALAVALTATPAFPGNVCKAAGLHGVPLLNCELRTYVHPTGKCGFGTETLATQYGYESCCKTASGEHFRPAGLTAASLQYPIGTHLHVTNPHTGLSAVVRVNDHGPYTIAKIDLSTGAAKAIGMVGKIASAYLCVSVR